MIFTSNGLEVALLETNSVSPHEECVSDILREIELSLSQKRIVEKSLLVGLESRIILDGHHRYSALKRLGCRYVPAVLLREDNDTFSLASRRPEFEITHRMVVEMVRSGKRFPPKTTRYCTRYEVGEINLCLSYLDPVTESQKGELI